MNRPDQPAAPPAPEAESGGPASNGTGATAPSGPVRFQLAFQCDGEEWIAYASGKGAYGTGRFGLAALQAVHFARADQPEQPLYEALLAAGRFAGLFERELIDLFRNAQRIVVPEAGAAPAPRRFSLEEDLS